MKVFITGITGGVGGACANYFVSLGYEVSGMGRKNNLPEHVSPECNYTCADICRPLPDIDADIVIHAAALASDSATWQQAYEANVEGTKNVMNAANEATHFVHISSSSVYDFSDGKLKKEEDAGSNVSHLSVYGKTKWLAEKAVSEASCFTKKTILRPRAIYGKHDQILLPRLLRLIKGNRLLLPANLSKAISLTHINNLVQAVMLCIDKQKAASALFNVADKESYDLHEVLTTLLPAIAGKPLFIRTIPASLFDLAIKANEALRINEHLNRFAASSLTQSAMLNINSISTTLGYSPTVNFYNSYEEIINWIHNEEGWRYYFAKPTQQIHFV